MAVVERNEQGQTKCQRGHWRWPGEDCPQCRTLRQRKYMQTEKGKLAAERAKRKIENKKAIERFKKLEAGLVEVPFDKRQAQKLLKYDKRLTAHLMAERCRALLHRYIDCWEHNTGGFHLPASKLAELQAIRLEADRLTRQPMKRFTRNPDLQRE